MNTSKQISKVVLDTKFQTIVNHLLLIICRVVIETMKEVDSERKCYRMIGGILVEGTVKEILPNLMTNSEEVSSELLWILFLFFSD